MASRTVAAPKTVDLIEVFVKLEEFDSTKDNPTSVKDMAIEMGITEKDMFDALGKLEDAGLADFDGRGLNSSWFIVPEGVNAENAAEIAKAALNQPAAKKTAAKPVVKAAEPVKAANGENVTVPVSDGSENRRELDAAKGERLISENIVKEMRREDIALGNELKTALAEMAEGPVSAKVTLPKPFVPEFHESDIAKNGLELEEPEFIPECPEGVNENAWYMAHAAITQSARDWWTKYVNTQLTDANDHLMANMGC